jgi:hypothetical protein
VGKPEEKRWLGRPISKWEVTIEIDLKTGMEGLEKDDLS